jgi:hypothetical protein
MTVPQEFERARRVHEVLGNAVDQIRAIAGEAEGPGITQWYSAFSETVERSVSSTAHLTWLLIQEHEMHT